MRGSWRGWGTIFRGAGVATVFGFAGGAAGTETFCSTGIAF
jgi:hypothetical protein